MKKGRGLGVTIVFVLALAQGSKVHGQALGYTPPVNMSTTTTTSEKLYWYSKPTWVGGYKTSNSLGRLKDFGNMVRSRNELYIGVKSQKGWGIYANVAAMYASGSPTGVDRDAIRSQRAAARGVDKSMMQDSEMMAGNRSGFMDPGLSFLHPVYSNLNLNIAGQLRMDFPVSDYSVASHVWHQSYSSFLLLKLKNRWDLSNAVLLRHVIRDYYAARDARWSAGNMTGLSRRLNRWCKLGVGHQFQYSWSQTEGWSTELYTMADFTLTPNIFAGPRLKFPLILRNPGYESAQSVSTANISAEFYLQATL